MYCKVCGAIINDSSLEYCSNCGHSLQGNGLVDVGSNAEMQEKTEKIQQEMPPQIQAGPGPMEGQKLQEESNYQDATLQGMPNYQGIPQPQGMPQPQMAPQPQSPLQQIPPTKKSFSGAKWIILIAVIVAVLATAGVGIFLYLGHSQAKSIDQFKTRLSGFEGIKSQYDLGQFEEEYNNVIDRCNECIEEKNVNVIDVLEEQMEDVKNNVINHNNEEIEKWKEEIEKLQNEYIKENERLQVENSIKRADVLIAEQKYKDAYEYYEKALDVLKQKQKENTTTEEPEDKNQPAWSDHSEFYFWDSDIRYLTSDELSPLTEEQLRIARNEIFARHGRRFESQDLQQYFDGCSWYRGTINPKDFDDDSLSKVEKANIKKIKEREKALNGEIQNKKSVEKVNGFYIYDSDIRYLTKDELSIYSAKELRIIRNEIYARHGRKFTSKDLQQYFNGCDWYNGCIEVKDFDDDQIFSDVEKANVKLIQEVEKKYN
ncbi:MAG: YARHG domain-containing protein [bacterium]|nr:YARHG domain-containing protein [bacterium]